MLNRSNLFIAIALCMLTACSHDDNGPSEPPVYICPFNPLLGSAAQQKCDGLTNAWGLITINAVVGQMVYAPLDTHHVNYQWVSADFYDATGNSAPNAGSIKINNTTIPIRGSWYYLEDSLHTLWNESSSNTWDIAGGGTTPAIYYTAGGTLPDFTGTLPDTISSTNNLMITFNTTNTTNADLARISLWKSGNVPLSGIVNTINGSATIPATQVLALKNYNGLHLNDPVFLQITLISYVLQNFNNKPYAFAKTKTIVKNVVIN